MNEVEKYQRETGKWHTPVNTDWLGRAVKGTWWPNYYAAWLDAHGAERDERAKKGDREFGPGGWAPDDNYRDFWFSDTPDWDKQWFRNQGVRPPKRWTTRDRLTWVDCGGGLSQRGKR